MVWLVCNVWKSETSPWPDDSCCFPSPSGPASHSWALFRLLPECSSESLGLGSTSWIWTGTRRQCSMTWTAPCPSTLGPTSPRTTTGWSGTQTASTFRTGEAPSAAGAMHRWGCRAHLLSVPSHPLTGQALSESLPHACLCAGPERDIGFFFILLSFFFC